MDLEQLSQQAFSNVKTKTGYDLEAELNKPLLSTARHRFKFIHGFTKHLVDFYESLIAEHSKDNSAMTTVYHIYLRKSLEGDNSEFKGIRDSLKMYFHIREFQQDKNKKIAAAKYFVELYDLIEANATKIDSARLKILNGIDPGYAQYYDSSYIFDACREIPNEVILGIR